MRRTLLIVLSALFLTACSSAPQKLFHEQVMNSQTPLAQTPQEAIQNAHAIEMPVDPGWRPPQWTITAQEPRVMLDGVPSNYRVFTIRLEQNNPFRINVNSWCVNACLGFSKYVLNPYLILMNSKGEVVARGSGMVRGSVGSIDQEVSGTVADSDLYYLIVAADNRSLGKPIIIDHVMMIGGANRSITPLKIGMGSYPFGSVAPYLNTSGQ